MLRSRDVGGGEPTDDLEGICCRVADQCETDADCGTWEDPVAVPMCCSYEDPLELCCTFAVRCRVLTCAHAGTARRCMAKRAALRAQSTRRLRAWLRCTTRSTSPRSSASVQVLLVFHSLLVSFFFFSFLSFSTLFLSLFSSFSSRFAFSHPAPAPSLLSPPPSCFFRSSPTTLSILFECNTTPRRKKPCCAISGTGAAHSPTRGMVLMQSIFLPVQQY